MLWFAAGFGAGIATAAFTWWLVMRNVRIG